MTKRLPDPARWQRFAAAGATGVVMALAYPPLHLGLLALIGLAPLCWAWRDASPREAAALGFLAGVAYFGLVLSWAHYFGAVAVFPLVGAMASSWAAVGAGVGWLRRLGLRSAWLTAALWVVGEAVIGRWPLGGFPWGEVGVALHDWSPARALASWGGVPLVSFLVVVVNGLLLEAALAGRGRAPRPLGWAAAGLAGVVVAVTVLDAARFEPTPTGHLRYALLQGNDLDRSLTNREIDRRYLPDSHFRLAATLHGPYDLVVFPESSMDADPQHDVFLASQLRDVARAHGTAVLANALVRDTKHRSFNTNLLYDPDGTLQGTYAKQHLVPFGEYVPWRSHLGFISELQQVPIDYTSGHATRIFQVKGHALATVICFESAFAPLVRDFVRHGAQVIVVTTNNRSYRRSGNSAQHLAMSQMRAAETGRPVLHASISGISGVIDASGRVRHTTSMFVRTVVTGEVTTTTGETPYVRFGDWAVWSSVLAVLAAVAIGLLLARRRSERSNGVTEP